MKFSNSEKLDMLLVYGECNRNAIRAKAMYAERYPERIQPSRTIFERMCKSLRENGSFNVNKRSVRKTATSDENAIAVLATVIENPRISTRQISRCSGISKSSVLRILHKNKYHPFHLALHQELYGTDFENRILFCQWFLHQITQDNYFLQNMLFTDEATFTNRGQINLKNLHYWAAENPHWMREVNHQHPWGVNVWCGILGNQLIGPYFIDNRLTGQKYANFLNNDLPHLLENVPLNIRARMWYQHDGCPAHYARIVRETLDTKFPNRWIGRGGQLWPPRSPDLTPLDYFLWGTLKDAVYRETPTTPENMKQRIREACITLSPDMIQNAVSSLVNRLQHCIDTNGHHFEHLR